MTDIFELQSKFMEGAGQKINREDITQCWLYDKLIKEETLEFSECDNEDDLIGGWLAGVKEACDILVVTSGWLISVLGKEKAQKAYELVHASNMEKLVGKIEKREGDGKILKNEHFKTQIKEKLMADLAALLD